MRDESVNRTASGEHRACAHRFAKEERRVRSRENCAAEELNYSDDPAEP